MRLDDINITFCIHFFKHSLRGIARGQFPFQLVIIHGSSFSNRKEEKGFVASSKLGM
jgi:hypothetical protein